MKSYTDLEQSKKLAEILPIESADMRYHTISQYNPYPCDEIVYTIDFNKPSGIDTPCWSLAALLEVLPKIVKRETLFIETSASLWHIGYRNIYIAREDNLFDACVELIIKLKEQNLI